MAVCGVNSERQPVPKTPEQKGLVEVLATQWLSSLSSKTIGRIIGLHGVTQGPVVSGL